MNARLAMVTSLLVLSSVLIGFDVHARRAARVAQEKQNELAIRLASVLEEETALAHELEAIRVRRETLQKPISSNVGAASRAGEASPNADSPGAQMSVIGDSAELRSLRVRVFVGEQRLKFAAVLRQLALTPEQLARFDEIQAEYQEAALDLASAAKKQGVKNSKDLASLRRDVVAARDAQMRELLGRGYETWEGALQSQGAREAADELLRQIYQSTGELPASERRALYDLVKRHSTTRDRGNYDWNAIAGEASNVLSGPKLDALRTALNLRIFSEKMTIMATGRP